MAIKSAHVMATDVGGFLEKARAALATTEAFQKRLVDDPAFADLWQRDSAAALREAGIDPEARQEVGLPAYDRGPECNWCVTPMGNPCHC